MLRPLAIALLVASSLAAGNADAHEFRQASGPADIGELQRVAWVHSTADEHSVSPPSKLAIIACRVEPSPRDTTSLAPQVTYPDWRLPVECMRVIETVTDAAAMSNFWLRQLTPNLGDQATCVEVAMTYAPVWEASHKNWTIVKVGYPTKIVNADGRVIGWHMPECQGTLPGTNYPLRCRFDPSEI